MEKLIHSGVPLYLDEESHVMAVCALLKMDGFSRKETGKMTGLLAKEENLPMEEPFYDVYRGIAYPEDEELLKKHNFRYDITIIMPGQVNGECKKTSGHYHGFNPQRTNTYAEVYEVIKGTALYVLQKSPNFDCEDSGELMVEDLILATVHQGETIIIPPNYGHASVNIGDGPLVFSNLAYVPCPVNYNPVRYYHGMCYYIIKKDKEIELERNLRYQEVPEPKFAGVKENPHLGIQFGKPVYQSFRENPNSFRFLREPDSYVDEIMSMLDYRADLVK